MIKCSIGMTTTKKEILIDLDGEGVNSDYETWKNDELFEALMAVEYLLLRELRRDSGDIGWLRSLRNAQAHLFKALGEAKISEAKASAGLHSAFAARDYGKTLVHRHFRSP